MSSNILEPETIIQSSSAMIDRSRSAMSLPFTYCDEQQRSTVFNRSPSICIESKLERWINKSDRINVNTIDTVARNRQDLIVSDNSKREHHNDIHPTLHSQTLINRRLEFQPRLSQTNLTSSEKSTAVHLPIEYHDDPLVHNNVTITSVIVVRGDTEKYNN
jgi:hypothetical protein